MTDSNLITVSEFKVMMPAMDITRYDDPTISGFISSASKQASDYLGYTPLAEDIVNESQTGYITTEGDLLIFPKKPPISSVVAVGIARGSIALNIQLADGNGTPRYNLDYTGRNLRFPYQFMTLQSAPVMLNFLSLRGSQFLTTMSYRGGFEVAMLPQPIKVATAYFMADLLSDQFNMMGAQSMHQGGIGYTFAAGKNGDFESMLVKKAERLLGPYRRMG